MMRCLTAISTSAALLLSAACTNYLTLDNSPEEPVLVVNADLVSGEGEHEVWLSVADGGRLVPPGDDAAVRCYVNGELAAWSNEAERAENFRKFTIEAEFAPGDVVRIEAGSGELEAWAENVFPAACEVEVDSSSVRNTGTAGRDAGRLYSFRMTVHDLPGQASWYRALLPECWVQPAGTDGVTIPPLLVRELAGDYYSDTDPIFEGTMSSVIPDPDIAGLLGLSTINHCRVFTDRIFEDGTYSFDFTVDQSRLPRIYDRTDSRMVFAMATLNEDDYRYFCYVNAAMTTSLLSQPLTTVCNVRGGLGYVSSMTATKVSIQMKRIE